MTDILIRSYLSTDEEALLALWSANLPFGVREGMQGQGIGTVLLARCLRAMQAQGHHHAWVLWTSDETADKVYARFGFKETRRFAVLRHQL